MDKLENKSVMWPHIFVQYQQVLFPASFRFDDHLSQEEKGWEDESSPPEAQGEIEMIQYQSLGFAWFIRHHPRFFSDH